MQFAPQPRTKLYGDLAFAVLVLMAYAQFSFSRRLYGEPWQVVVAFVLGGAYFMLGVFHHHLVSERSRGRVYAYYFVQCLLSATATLISPVRGIFFVLAM